MTSTISQEGPMVIVAAYAKASVEEADSRDGPWTPARERKVDSASHREFVLSKRHYRLIGVPQDGSLSWVEWSDR